MIMCKARRHEHSPERIDTRAGSYKRKSHARVGEVEVKVPKLRQQTFETAAVGRYRVLLRICSIANAQNFLMSRGNRPNSDMDDLKAEFPLLTIKLPQELTTKVTPNPARYHQGDSRFLRIRC